MDDPGRRERSLPARPRGAATGSGREGEPAEGAGLRAPASRRAHVMAAGRWPLAAGRWPLAAGRWPLAAGRWPLAAGRWPLAAGRWPLAAGRWPLAAGRWPLAAGRWPLAAGRWPLAAGRWPLAAGRWPLAAGRWPLAAGRWPLAAGRWPLAAGRWQIIRADIAGRCQAPGRERHLGIHDRYPVLRRARHAHRRSQHGTSSSHSAGSPGARLFPGAARKAGHLSGTILA